MGGYARVVNRRILLANDAPASLCSLQSFRLLHHCPFPSRFAHRHRTSAASCIRFRINASLSVPVPNPNHVYIIDRFLSISTSDSSFCQSVNPFSSCNSNPISWSSSWLMASDDQNGHGKTLSGPKSPEVTVVLLGWLGGKRKHLKRYAELYNSLGMNVFMFTAEVRDFMSLDLKKDVEKRMSALEEELFSWVSKESNTHDRFLIFHSFSNTGLFVYGNIINLMRNRNSPSLEEKIRGTIIDSGGGGLLDPKVWAAGWAAALLKKRSSTTDMETYKDSKEKQESFLEALLLGATEKFFSVFLSLPEMKKKMDEIIAAIHNPPNCPQLYLYSTADKVIPFDSIEAMVEKQMQHGKKVSSYNFVSSPHVDHFRNFPDTYSRLISSFVQDCFAMVKKL